MEYINKDYINDFIKSNKKDDYNFIKNVIKSDIKNVYIFRPIQYQFKKDNPKHGNRTEDIQQIQNKIINDTIYMNRINGKYVKKNKEFNCILLNCNLCEEYINTAYYYSSSKKIHKNMCDKCLEYEKDNKCLGIIKKYLPGKKVCYNCNRDALYKISDYKFRCICENCYLKQDNKKILKKKKEMLCMFEPEITLTFPENTRELDGECTVIFVIEYENNINLKVYIPCCQNLSTIFENNNPELLYDSVLKSINVNLSCDELIEIWTLSYEEYEKQRLQK